MVTVDVVAVAAFPTDFTVTVLVLVSALAAVAGTSTLTQTARESPEATEGVVVSSVVHVGSKNFVVHVPAADSANVSALEPLFVIVRLYGTLVPTRPPSRCDAGARPNANG